MKGRRFFLTISLIVLTTFNFSAVARTRAGGDEKFTEGTAMSQSTGEKTMEVFGVKLRYLEAGPANAPAIILIAAPFLRKETWQSTGHFEAFAAQYHVYALDNVGQGNSGKPLINYSIGTLVDFLRGFMDAGGSSGRRSSAPRLEPGRSSSLR
jgi:hypothetical protein